MDKHNASGSIGTHGSGSSYSNRPNSEKVVAFYLRTTSVTRRYFYNHITLVDSKCNSYPRHAMYTYNTPASQQGRKSVTKRVHHTCSASTCLQHTHLGHVNYGAHLLSRSWLRVCKGHCSADGFIGPMMLRHIISCNYRRCEWI